MAKRFIDTGLFDDPWFMDLTKDGKILWIYVITRCNHAGIIEINRRMILFQTGIENIDDIILELGDRMVRIFGKENEQLGNSMSTVSKQLYFIPKFIKYQYPEFPNSKSKAQESTIKILKKYGEELKGWVTLPEELPNPYSNSYSISNGLKGGLGGKKESSAKQSKIVIPR